MARVLIIDDQPDMLRVVSHMLRSAGHETWCAEGGKTGESSFHKIQPDLVILDIWMPEQDGVETLRKIRSLAPTTKILVMSGQPNKAGMPVFDVAQVLGAVDTIQKPFSADELLMRVDAILCV